MPTNEIYVTRLVWHAYCIKPKVVTAKYRKTMVLSTYLMKFSSQTLSAESLCADDLFGSCIARKCFASWHIERFEYMLCKRLFEGVVSPSGSQLEKYPCAFMQISSTYLVPSYLLLPELNCTRLSHVTPHCTCVLCHIPQNCTIVSLYYSSPDSTMLHLATPPCTAVCLQVRKYAAS